MPPDDFFTFLRASFRCIEEEQPEAYRALVAAMGMMRARLVADGVVRTVRFDACAWKIEVDAGDTDPDIRFDSEVILDMVDGRLTLEASIDQGRLHMQGSVAAVEQLHGTLMIFLEGLVRSSGAPALLERYRRKM